MKGMVKTNGGAIKRKRIQRCFTEERIGAVLNVSTLTVIQWQNGCDAEFERIEELSWMLHCDVNELILNED